MQVKALDKFIKKHFEGSAKEFANSAGVTAAGVSQWRKRGKVPAYIASWCKLYEEVITLRGGDNG